MNIAIIKTLREKQGMTQTQLAFKAGLSRQTIADIESGRTKEPSITVYNKLIKALGYELQITIPLVK